MPYDIHEYIAQGQHKQYSKLNFLMLSVTSTGSKSGSGRGQVAHCKNKHLLSLFGKPMFLTNMPKFWMEF